MQYTECGVQQNINRFILNFRIYEGIKHYQPANVGPCTHNSGLKGQGEVACRRRYAMLYQVSEKSWYVSVSYYVGMYCSCTPFAVYIQMLTAWPDTTFELQSITPHTGAHTGPHGDFWDTLYKGFMLL
jgi:hypothetical protein